MRPLLLFLVALPALLGQDTPDSLKKVKTWQLDLSVPESPGFTILGLTPQSIVRPDSLRAFATSLLNGVDHNGNLQTGFALDFAPYALTKGNLLTLQQYQDSPMTRFLYRTKLSVATTKGAVDNDKATRLAAGVHFTLFDSGDPRRDPEKLNGLVKLAEDVLAGPAISPFSTQEEIDKINAMREDKLRKVRAAYLKELEARRKSSWNQGAWNMGFAYSHVAADGAIRKLEPNGGAAWTSYSHSAGQRAQLILHARYRRNDTIPDAAVKGLYFRQDSALLGGRIRVGNADTTVSGEGAYLQVRPVDRPVDKYLRLTVGVDRRLSNDLWLNIGIGGESGRADGRNKIFILGEFKWGFSSKPTL